MGRKIIGKYNNLKEKWGDSSLKINWKLSLYKKRCKMGWSLKSVDKYYIFSQGQGYLFVQFK